MPTWSALAILAVFIGVMSWASIRLTFDPGDTLPGFCRDHHSLAMKHNDQRSR
jgi:hypothetical protein